MYAHRIDVFHIAHGDDVALCVTHDLILYLFPARDAFLYQHLMDARQAQAVDRDLDKLRLIVGYAAAAAAERVGWPHDDRVINFLGKRYRILNRLDHL